MLLCSTLCSVHHTMKCTRYEAKSTTWVALTKHPCLSKCSSAWGSDTYLRHGWLWLNGFQCSWTGHVCVHKRASQWLYSTKEGLRSSHRSEMPCTVTTAICVGFSCTTALGTTAPVLIFTCACRCVACQNTNLVPTDNIADTNPILEIT